MHETEWKYWVNCEETGKFVCKGFLFGNLLKRFNETSRIKDKKENIMIYSN